MKGPALRVVEPGYHPDSSGIVTPSYYGLGASLYTPCTHPNLQSIMENGVQNAKSMVFCLEDAIREHEVQPSLQRLEKILPGLQMVSFLRFIRPRNPSMLKGLMTIGGIENIDGFVLPKVDENNIDAYFSAIPDDSVHYVMVTIETEVAFSSDRLNRLKEKLEKHREKILCLRIGGNDLLNILGLKRMSGRTIYETPLRPVIDNIMMCFKPAGYDISAPVFDIIGDKDTLEREMEQDMSYGFFAKTAIHPTQIEVIHRSYRVCSKELEMAKMIVDDKSPAVFKLNGQMVEPTTHQNWALSTLSRREMFGLRG